MSASCLCISWCVACVVLFHNLVSVVDCWLVIGASYNNVHAWQWFTNKTPNLVHNTLWGRFMKVWMVMNQIGSEKSITISKHTQHPELVTCSFVVDVESHF